MRHAAATVATLALLTALNPARAAGEANGLIVQLRDAQQRAETDADRLLRAWYDRHPDLAPGAPRSHTWPVSFMPRYLAQEAEVGPLMRAFDQARAQRESQLRQWAWLSPPLSMAMLADELAGIDAPRHAGYKAAVDRYEAHWRDVFVPKIMSYRGVTHDDLAQLPRFAGIGEHSQRGWRHVLSLAMAAVAAAVAVVLLRARIARG